MLKRKGKNVLASDLWENLQFHRSPKLDINLNSDFVNRHNFDSTISIKSKPLQQSRDLDNDLPDGSCFSRVLRMDSNQQTEFFLKSTVRECQYIGSFPVSGEDNNSRAEFVRVQLDQIKERIRKKDVLLVISLTGLKVYNPDGKSVLMAHALRRISFATCDPDNNQFSFLAREPNSHFSHQYCHSFLAANAIEAEELSREVGAAFRMAYAQQLAQPIAIGLSVGNPSAAEVARGGCSTASILLGSPILRQSTCRGDAHPANRSCWAKKLTGKTSHPDHMTEQAIEMSVRSSPSIQLESSCTYTEKEQNSMNHLSASTGSLRNSPVVDLWSPLGGNSSSSSEENNSPTDLNSYKKIKEKPPMLKNLEVVHEGAPADDTFSKDIARSSSGGYINEESSWEDTSSLRSSYTVDKNKIGSHFHTTHRINKFSLSSNSLFTSASPTDKNSMFQSCSGASNVPISSSCDQNLPSTNTSFTNVSEKIYDCKRKSNTRIANITPPPPERYDSLSSTLSEEKELRIAPWFQAGIPREIALEILSQEPVGSFMVRESTSKPGCFALSLRVPRDFHQTGIAHYLIMRTGRGYKIKGFMKEFGTLTALITHHSVMPELLPCPLSLSKHNPTFKKHDSEDMVDINEDPDYNLLSDFRKMLSDINV